MLDAIPGMTMVAQQTANWSQTEGFDVAEALLQQYPDVKGIIAGNDTMALGAQAAVSPPASPRSSSSASTAATMPSVRSTRVS